MPPRRYSHPKCQVGPLADTLRADLLATMRSLRAEIASAEAKTDERTADQKRVDLLSVGELLRQLEELLQRHAASDGLSEASAHTELASLRRAHAALTR